MTMLNNIHHIVIRVEHVIALQISRIDIRDNLRQVGFVVDQRLRLPL